jgi:hypothetical protein
MAISIDTVYQRVLALANKEQRGYVTPQEFNLFANQAQLEIFEQYFYDKGQFNRLPKDNTPYADLGHMLEEKISVFKKRQQPVTITNVFGDGTLPSDVYRLDNLTRLALTGVTNSYANIIEEVTEDELLVIERTPLTRPTPTRPIYVRTSGTTVKIKPHSSSPSASAAVFFTQSGDIDSDITASVDTGSNIAFIEVGQVVSGNGIVVGTTVTSINYDTGVLGLSTAATATGARLMTFASNDVKCNYIAKPSDCNWGYTEINGTALYNSASTTDFALHQSEETTLVYKILTLAGVSIADPNLYQLAAQEEMKINQQEKQ